MVVMVEVRFKSCLEFLASYDDGECDGGGDGDGDDDDDERQWGACRVAGNGPTNLMVMTMMVMIGEVEKSSLFTANRKMIRLSCLRGHESVAIKFLHPVFLFYYG
ncbi:hypothetical protein E2C01_093948 [Portunus trituberculatus]|uniref:Uncharacterized protein n=1 Tax=Portunus trituberculatus TaxID=210409 RepID=A0A5B7K1T4_PORTR|nr:hypothetical protein [Portunus trituberculatus]